LAEGLGADYAITKICELQKVCVCMVMTRFPMRYRRCEKMTRYPRKYNRCVTPHPFTCVP
jgi:hypothetical protein